MGKYIYIAVALIIAFIVIILGISYLGSTQSVSVTGVNVTSSVIPQSSIIVTGSTTFHSSEDSQITVTVEVSNNHVYSAITVTGFAASSGFTIPYTGSPPITINPGQNQMINVDLETPSTSYNGPVSIVMNAYLSKITVTAIDLETTITGLLGPSENTNAFPGFNATPGSVVTQQLTLYNNNLISSDTINSIYIAPPAGSYSGANAWGFVVSPNLPQVIPAGDSLQFTIDITMPTGNFTGILALEVSGSS